MSLIVFRDGFSFVILENIYIFLDILGLKKPVLKQKQCLKNVQCFQQQTFWQKNKLNFEYDVFQDKMEQTYVMIKPDGVHRGLVGRVIQRFEEKGLQLIGLRLR